MQKKHHRISLIALNTFRMRKVKFDKFVLFDDNKNQHLMENGQHLDLPPGVISYWRSIFPPVATLTVPSPRISMDGALYVWVSLIVKVLPSLTYNITSSV